MQELYNQLMTGEVYINDKGETINRPPSSLMLRAARTIKQMADVNTANNIALMNIQKLSEDNQNTIALLNEQIYQLRSKNESVCNDSGEGQEAPSNVGDSGNVDLGINPRSEEGIQAEDSSPSSS